MKYSVQSKSNGLFLNAVDMEKTNRFFGSLLRVYNFIRICFAFLP